VVVKIIGLISLLLIAVNCNTTGPPYNNGNGQDTTSHNFTWETFEFGQHSSSDLYDVIIINENNIWAVGEIFLNDSHGIPDPQAYGIARWNGDEWLLEKVPYHDFNQTTRRPGPLFSIANFDGEIFVVSYANLLKWTGSDWEEKAFFMEQIPFNGQVLKIWGTDSNNIYCVGRNGAIFHYFGTGWQEVESGTDLNLYDIYGEYSRIKGEYEILITAANFTVSFDKQILKINNSNTVTPLATEGIPYSIKEVWFEADREYYIVGAGLFSKNNVDSEGEWEELDVNYAYLECIDGSGLNDIMIGGHFGELHHFNGVSWKSYSDMPSSSILKTVKMKDGLVLIVGNNNRGAFIAVGKR
jgi:hypothetical protein